MSLKERQSSKTKGEKGVRGEQEEAEGRIDEKWWENGESQGQSLNR
jgi:hypothetical protein